MSQAYDVANTDLANINDPKTFDRQKWLEKNIRVSPIMMIQEMAQHGI